jgi:hypothetical protein
VLHHGLQTIAQTPGLNFFDILALLDPRTPQERAWSKRIVENITDPELRRWWDGPEMQDPKQRAKKGLSDLDRAT